MLSFLKKLWYELYNKIPVIETNVQLDQERQKRRELSKAIIILWARNAQTTYSHVMLQTHNWLETHDPEILEDGMWVNVVSHNDFWFNYEQVTGLVVLIAERNKLTKEILAKGWGKLADIEHFQKTYEQGNKIG